MVTTRQAMQLTLSQRYGINKVSFVDVRFLITLLDALS